MQGSRSTLRCERGITVLTLLLLIVALVIAAIFLVRYLRTRPAAPAPSPTSLMVSPQDPSRSLS